MAVAQGPEPAPWWQQVEQTQALFEKWCVALTVMIAAVAGVITFVITKIFAVKELLHKQKEELDKRLDRQRSDLTSQQAQINTVALNSPPPPLAMPASGGTTNVTVNENQKT